MHPHTSFATLQKIFLGLGVAALLVSCAMTAKFGATMSTAHAFGLVLVTIMAAFIMPAIRFVKDAGVSKVGTHSLMALGVFFLSVEFFSDLGYTIGTREKSTVESHVQTAAYTNQQNRLSDQRSSLALWKKRLEDLTSQNAWATSVSADGLRAQLAVFDKDVELETARGGCKTRCRTIMAKKADIENRIATAEEVADLSKQIAATQRLVDGATDKAVATQDGFSSVVAQTSFVAQLYGIAAGDDAKSALNPDETRMTLTQILVGFFIALSVTALPATAFYFAFFGRKLDVTEIEDIWQRQAKRNEAISKRMSQVQIPAADELATRLPANAKHLSEEFTINDHRGVNELKTRLAINRQRALAVLGEGAFA